MKTIIALLLTCTLGACATDSVVRAKPISDHINLAGAGAGFSGEFWTDQRCYDLLQKRDGWTTAAKFLVGAGGATVLTTPISDDKRVQWSIGISAAVVSAMGLAALWMGSAKSDELEAYCSVEAPVSPEYSIYSSKDEEPIVVEVTVVDAGL